MTKEEQIRDSIEKLRNAGYKQSSLLEKYIHPTVKNGKVIMVAMVTDDMSDLELRKLLGHLATIVRTFHICVRGKKKVETFVEPEIQKWMIEVYGSLEKGRSFIEKVEYLVIE